MKKNNKKMSFNDCFTVEKKEEGKRIDLFLSNRFENHSRTYFQYLLENDAILVNSKRVKKRYLVNEKDQIEIFFIATPEISLQPEDIPLDIIYEDEHLLVINKPYGMVVHPAPGNYSKTLVNALLFHCKGLFDDASLRPGIVHRLDKDTTGVLIAAKTKRSHQKLIEQFSQRKIYKEYLAICIGRVKDGIINKPIARHPVKRKLMAIIESGKEAISHVENLSFNDNFSLAKIVLKTGRTHQIRVHLKSENTPILGDSIYGIDSMNLSMKCTRQLLHAHRMKITHPITNEPLTFQAPLREDMRKFLLDRFSLIDPTHL